MEELEIFEQINIYGLLIGVVFGIFAQKKQFCFSGSIKDYILTKSTKRACSILMAMIVAILSTSIISSYFDLDLKETGFYRENINYFTIILGGVLFGSGMMIADGCSNRHLIKFAQGDSNSLITIIFIAIFAYATTKGLIYGFLNPIMNNPTLIKLSSYLQNETLNLYIVLLILFIMMLFLLKKIKRIFSLYDGFIIGLLVSLSWLITGVLGQESIERIISLNGITFVYPTAKTLELFTYYEINQLSFSISIILGVIIGSFLMSKQNKKYSFGCTANQGVNKIKYNMIGGALMGTGGILSLGCTVGQGLTGISTLAFASFIAIISILISAYITALILNKYYKLPMCFIFEWEDNKPDYHI